MPLALMDRFVMTRSYAVDPASFSADLWANTWRCSVQALWFRRKSGAFRAHTGRLWDHRLAAEGRPDFDWLADNLETARYGGQVEATWDGMALWTPTALPDSERARLAAVLDPALRWMLHHPGPSVAPPAGWTGWFSLTEPVGRP